MRTSTLKNCLLPTLLYLGLPSASLSQIYNVGSDDGFSFSCAGSCAESGRTKTKGENILKIATVQICMSVSSGCNEEKLHRGEVSPQ